MKPRWNILKLVLLLVVSVLLFAFSNNRNEHRLVQDVKLTFLGDNNLFITQNSVSKLLIQNQLDPTDKAKRIIDLNDLEAALNSNEMIKKAEVYMSVDGAISAEIEQKKPLARVLSGSFYIDDTGSWMPLSDNYAARVPLVTGSIDQSNLEEVYTIAKRIHEDEFLKRHIIEIHQGANAEFELRLRNSDLRVELGDLSELDRKFSNLKAFYQKVLKDDIMDRYRKLNLRFTSQVICTKA